MEGIKPEEQEKELALAQQALQQSLMHLATTLGLEDPASEFQPIDFIKDELGMRHFRFQQVYSGLQVFSNHMIVHVNKDGGVRDTTGTYRQGLDALNLNPAIDAAEAIEIARTDCGEEANEAFTAELVIYPEQASAQNHLAYMVTLPFWRDNLPMRMRYFIDAHTKEILFRYNDQSVTGEATSTRGIAHRLAGEK